MDMAMFLVLAVTVAISTVCAQPQCTSHSQRLPYPVESQAIGYSSVSRSVYLVGGDDLNNAKRDTVWRWHTESATEDWFVTASTPAPTVMDSKGTQLSVTIGEVMYVCSPRTDNDRPYTAGSAIHPFNTTSEAWLPPIPFTTPLGPWLVRPCATHNDTHIFLIDGYVSSDYRDNTPLYIFVYEISSGEWTTQTPDAPFGNGRVRRGWYGTACSYANSALYIFGGKYYPGLGVSGSQQIIDTIFRYDIDDEQFTLLDATLPAPRAYGPAVFDGEKFVFLPGGQGDNDVRWDTISIFDIETEQLLSEGIAAVLPFEDATATILGEELWVFGGDLDSGSTDVVQRCDICSFYPTQEPTQDPTASPTVSPTTAPPTTPAPTTAAPTTMSPTTPAPTTASPTTASPTSPPTAVPPAPTLSSSTIVLTVREDSVEDNDEDVVAEPTPTPTPNTSQASTSFWNGPHFLMFIMIAGVICTCGLCCCAGIYLLLRSYQGLLKLGPAHEVDKNNGDIHSGGMMPAAVAVTPVSDRQQQKQEHGVVIGGVVHIVVTPKQVDSRMLGWTPKPLVVTTVPAFPGEDDSSDEEMYTPGPNHTDRGPGMTMGKPNDNAPTNGY